MADSYLYGPPPDPRQIHVDMELIEHPGLYLTCIGLGLAVSLLAAIRKQPGALRAWWFCLGQVIMLTSPLAAILGRGLIYGAYPTIDKAGSLLLYLDGVHRRLTFHPIDSLSDAAAQLVGVHMGHLWVTAFFDLFLSVNDAFNIQGIVYPALGWWAATLLMRQVSDSWRVAVLFGFPFGMGLHVFRDLNWYTIEKASVFALALYAWALVRAWQDGGRWRWIAAGVYLGAAFINWYWALVGAAGCALAVALSRSRNLAVAAAASAVAVLPLVALQFALLSGAASPGDPQSYLTERALLDSFSLVPAQWNRLELHRSLNLVAVGFCLVGLVRRRDDPLVLALALIAGGLFLLALGPQLMPGVPNPVYLALWHALPGFWRVAKPEVFFEGTWLLALTIGARGLQGRRLSGMFLYPLFMAGWLLMVRTHPVYPEFSQYQELKLGQLPGADPTSR